MGVATPIPPIAMNARRPEGRPAAGNITVEKVIPDFLGLGANLSCVFLQSIFFLNLLRSRYPYDQNGTGVIPAYVERFVPDGFTFTEDKKNQVSWNVAMFAPKLYWSFRYVAPGGTINNIFPVRFSWGGTDFPFT